MAPLRHPTTMKSVSSPPFFTRSTASCKVVCASLLSPLTSFPLSPNPKSSPRNVRDALACAAAAGDTLDLAATADAEAYVDLGSAAADGADGGDLVGAFGERPRAGERILTDFFMPAGALIFLGTALLLRGLNTFFGVPWEPGRAGGGRVGGGYAEAFSNFDEYREPR